MGSVALHVGWERVGVPLRYAEMGWSPPHAGVILGAGVEVSAAAAGHRGVLPRKHTEEESTKLYERPVKREV